jgi:hypothetical protein
VKDEVVNDLEFFQKILTDEMRMQRLLVAEQMEELKNQMTDAVLKRE